MFNSFVSLLFAAFTRIELYPSRPNEFVDRELLIINSSEIRWNRHENLRWNKNFVFKFTEFSLCLRARVSRGAFCREFSEGAKKKARSATQYDKFVYSIRESSSGPGASI
jgi:hypothetical protein